MSRQLVCRLVLATLLCLVLGFALGKPGESPQNVFFSASHAQRPKPDWTPTQVVSIQLDALRSARDSDVGIYYCFRFASPANRAVTGPEAAFAEMIRTSEYAVLTRSRGAIVGRAAVSGNYATVLATVVDDRAEPHVFRFFLSKQTEPPFLGCWMTDAVFEADQLVSGPTESEPGGPQTSPRQAAPAPLPEDQVRQPSGLVWGIPS